MMTIEELVARAKADGASDIHLICGIPPKYRLDGELRDMADTDAIRNLIRTGNTPQIANAIATSSAIGGQTMDQALSRLVRAGKITKETALHYARDADLVRKSAL